MTPARTPAVERSPRTYWALQALGWYGLASLQLLLIAAARLVAQAWPHSPEIAPELHAIDAAMAGVPMARAALESFGIYSAGLLFSHSLRAWQNTHGWPSLPAGARVWRGAVAGLLLGIPLALLQQGLSISALHPPIPGASPLMNFQAQVINWAGMFWLWLALYYAILAARRRRDARLHTSELLRALQQAELRSLKAQLNPHFLFNALNTVRALIADDPARAQAAVTQLARTLRYALNAGHEDQVTLSQELEIVDDYLALEALRLGERLHVQRSIAADALSLRVPVMLVQTLVENAIKHGIGELPSGGTLCLSAARKADALCIEVDNPCPARATAGGAGVGLHNSRERLRLLFGERAQLDLDLSQAGQAHAHLRIPVNA